MRSGYECAHRFKKESFGNLSDLIRKAEISICKLDDILKKHEQIFPTAKEKYTSKKKKEEGK